MFESLALTTVALYFIPAIIAMLRKHHNALAIGLLNLLLGWTLIGWIVAAVWAVTATRAAEPKPQAVELGNTQGFRAVDGAMKFAGYALLAILALASVFVALGMIGHLIGP